LLTVCLFCQRIRDSLMLRSWLLSRLFAERNCVTPIEHLAKTLLDAARDL